MPKKLLIVILLAMLLALPTGSIFAAGNAQTDLDFNDYLVDLVDYSLANGLRVILAEDHSAPVVAVDVWYNVGGADDPTGRSGFAHLFEHMMFNGSENIEFGQFHALLASVGARNNAYTTIDKTAYWEVIPANELPRALWMESDRMASLDVTQESFDNEREVVIEEFNQRVANRAFGASGRRLLTQPFDGYLPYERSTIGSIEDLNAATLDEVIAFHDTYYKPNNATLVIVGDIDVKQTQTLIQAYFGDIPAGEPLVPITERYPLPEAFPVSEIDPTSGCALGSSEILVDNLVELPRYVGTVVTPPRGTPDFYALDLLVDILGSGDSSRFQQNIVQQGLAASAFTGMIDFVGGTVFYVGALPNGDDTIELAQAVTRAELDRAIEEGVTEAELERVKQRLTVQTITSFREFVLNTAEFLQDAVATFGRPDSIADELEMYGAVTVADIERVAQSYFCDSPMNSLITLPEGAEVLADYPGLLVEPLDLEAGDEPTVEIVEIELTDETLAELPEGVISRAEIPASLSVTETTLPPFEIFTLENGLEAIFVEQTDVPKLQLQLFVGGSNAAAPADKQEVADFMADLITKGTKVRSAAQIAERIELVGGSVGASAALEWTSLSVNALSTDARLAFNMLSDMARHATFPQREFDVSKEQSLTFIEQAEVNPETLANRQFGRIAYGGHPYGYYTSRETVENISRDDVFEFYQTFYKPNNALLVIVGDLSFEEAKAQTERVFNGWQADEVPNFLDYPEAELGDTSVIYLVDRPGSEQTTIQLGSKGINALSPDRYAVTVGNLILGGGATSRLATNLREEQGYTYSVFSRFGRPSDTSTFRVITDVDKGATADAIGQILYELERITSEEIPGDELADAKGRIIGNFALAIEDPADFASQLATRRLSGVDLDELNSYLATIEQVTAAEIKTALSTYIETEQPILVVVGDAETVKPQLEQLGTVVVVDGDGNVVE